MTRETKPGTLYQLIREFQSTPASRDAGDEDETAMTELLTGFNPLPRRVTRETSNLSHVATLTTGFNPLPRRVTRETRRIRA